MSGLEELLPTEMVWEINQYLNWKPVMDQTIKCMKKGVLPEHTREYPIGTRHYLHPPYFVYMADEDSDMKLIRFEWWF